MVDFNNDVTVGTPAVDIERVSILQRRYEFIDAYEFWKKQNLNKIKSNEAVMRARLISLFLQIQGMLKRQLVDYEVFRRRVWVVKDEGDILDCFLVMNEALDRINLTKIDSRRHVDTLIAEDENLDAGL